MKISYDIGKESHGLLTAPLPMECDEAVESNHWLADLQRLEARDRQAQRSAQRLADRLKRHRRMSAQPSV